MNIAIENKDSILAMTLSGRLDTVTAPDFDKQVAEVITPVTQDIVMDCAGLEYISSAGLRSLIVMLKAAKASGHDMTLKNVPDSVMPVFDMTGFSSLFHL